MKSTGSGREGESIDKMDVLNKYLDFFPFKSALLEINTYLSSFKVNALTLFYRSLCF